MLLYIFLLLSFYLLPDFLYIISSIVPKLVAGSDMGFYLDNYLLLSKLSLFLFVTLPLCIYFYFSIKTRYTLTKTQFSLLLFLQIPTLLISILLFYMLYLVHTDFSPSGYGAGFAFDIASRAIPLFIIPSLFLLIYKLNSADLEMKQYFRIFFFLSMSSLFILSGFSLYYIYILMTPF